MCDWFHTLFSHINDAKFTLTTMFPLKISKTNIFLSGLEVKVGKQSNYHDRHNMGYGIAPPAIKTSRNLFIEIQTWIRKE